MMEIAIMKVHAMPKRRCLERGFDGGGGGEVEGEVC